MASRRIHKATHIEISSNLVLTTEQGLACRKSPESGAAAAKDGQAQLGFVQLSIPLPLPIYNQPIPGFLMDTNHYPIWNCRIVSGLPFQGRTVTEWFEAVSHGMLTIRQRSQCQTCGFVNRRQKGWFCQSHAAR